MPWFWQSAAAVQEAGERRHLDLQREILLAGISDTQGTIHANDAKCSAALITHGLVLAGTVAVSGAAAKLYPDAPGGLRVVALVLAGLALLSFLTSVLCLLRAVRPFHPIELAGHMNQSHRPPGVFFAADQRAPVGQEMASQMTRVHALTAQAALVDLTAESLKLAAIRSHESGWAKRGFAWLMVEVTVVVVYLVLVGWIALLAA